MAPAHEATPSARSPRYWMGCLACAVLAAPLVGVPLFYLMVELERGSWFTLLVPGTIAAGLVTYLACRRRHAARSEAAMVAGFGGLLALGVQFVVFGLELGAHLQ